MKITLISLMVLASFTAQAQESDLAVAAAGGSTEIAAVMTPAEAPAKAEYEVSCRAQAKEVAANAYRSCISDGRNAQIEQLKKDYQDQIAALKAKYEAEIKALAGANAEKAAVAPAKAIKAAAAPAVKAKKKPTAPVAGTKKSLNPGKAKAAPAKAVSTAAAPAAAAAPAVTTEEIKEMTIELKPAVKTVGATDDSTMDIPEPIAVENN